MKAWLISLLLFGLLGPSLPAASVQSAQRKVAGSQPRLTPQPPALLAEEKLVAGAINEKVVARNDPTQSYALYLPTNYTPDKQWPILYCFDPAARGVVPVRRFQAAAEKYGWIIAGSNNSQNGPVQPSLDANQTMWRDTHARFRLDDRRIYTCGFSGGARVAIWIAYLCNGCVAGVIACGAGFHRQINISANIPFVVFGTVGTDDFNFPELKNLDETLTKFGIAHRLELFAGQHEWLPEPLATKALEWLELQAMRTGRRARDEATINASWSQALTEARSYEESQQLYAAYRSYAAMLASFAGLHDLTDIVGKAARLKESRAVKAALDEEREEIGKQQSLSAQLNTLLAARQDNDPDVRERAPSEFKSMIAHLAEAAHRPQDTSQRRIARRVLNDVFAQFYEGGSNLLLRQSNYDEAISDFETAAVIAPDNPHVLYALASAYALKGEKRKAIATLQRAIEKGFNDLDRLANDKAFASLHTDSAYNELLKTLSKQH
jgi:tetratricopeptide (TPR) repeat protein